MFELPRINWIEAADDAQHAGVFRSPEETLSFLSSRSIADAIADAQERPLPKGKVKGRAEALRVDHSQISFFVEPDEEGFVA